MVLILAEADIPAMRAGVYLPLLDLALAALSTSVLSYQLQLSFTTRRAYVGDLPAELGQGCTVPALRAAIGGFGWGVKCAANRAYSPPLAVKAGLLRLISPIHRLTPFLFGFWA
jgi:hypothetical protein